MKALARQNPLRRCHPGRLEERTAVACPNCLFDFEQAKRQPRARCPRCGNEWEWTKLRVVKGGAS